MKLYFVKTPKFIKSYFKDYVWQINTSKKEIYLTFDDGPTLKVTNFVLDQLDKYNAKATFFCIGKNIVDNPLLFQKLIAKEHAIGNHTNSHLNGWKTKTTCYLEDINKCEQVMFDVINKNKLFRPPYGKIRKNQATQLQKLDYKIIMWSVLSGDFDTTISGKNCLKNIIKNTKSGSIIVLHDSKKAFEKLQFVLPKILNHFSNLGYTFKAL